MSSWKKYAVDKPYPELRVKEHNPLYVCLLQDDYAGYTSEFTAVNQYSYHHFYFKIFDKELAEVLHGISIVEMHHMEMLATLIIMLGGDPRFGGTQSTGCQYWSGIFPGYGSNTCERLQLDIRAEQDAIKIYRHHIQLIHDPCIKAVLERIVMDEEHHLCLFQEQYKRICKCK